VGDRLVVGRVANPNVCTGCGVESEVLREDHHEEAGGVTWRPRYARAMPIKIINHLMHGLIVSKLILKNDQLRVIHNCHIQTRPKKPGNLTLKVY
jgi:hypothetical protein